MGYDGFLTDLQAAFDANDPDDGIDRGDGYGRDYRIESLRVVPSDDGFDDLEVTVRTGPEETVSRVLFDQGWREASDLASVRAYAAYVVARWRDSLDGGCRSGSAGSRHLGVEASAAVVEASWQGLLKTLRARHHGVVVAGSEIEVRGAGGETFWVHVTPEEWHSFAVACDDGDSSTTVAADLLDRAITSRWDDEDHIVFFRGAFDPSIRAERPPVRSMLLRDERD